LEDGRLPPLVVGFAHGRAAEATVKDGVPCCDARRRCLCLAGLTQQSRNRLVGVLLA
jgi:hypothetical protein